MVFLFKRLTRLILCIFALGSIPQISAATTLQRYDFNVLITSTDYYHTCFDNILECEEGFGEIPSYKGPPRGSYGAGWITVEFPETFGGPDDDRGIDFAFSILGLPGLNFYLREEVTAFDPVTKDISFFGETFDDIFLARLYPGAKNGGGGFFYYEQDFSAANIARVEFRFFDVTVNRGDVGSSLQVATIPLPAGLSLLFTGIAVLGGLRRLRR